MNRPCDWYTLVALVLQLHTGQRCRSRTSTIWERRICSIRLVVSDLCHGSINEDDVLSMKIRDQLRALFAAFAHGNLPTPQLVVAVVQDRFARRRLLEQPALADQLTKRAIEVSGTACDDVEAELGAFIDREQSGTGLPTWYAPIALHLTLCPWCAESYDLIRAIETAQAGGVLPRWPNAPLSLVPSAPAVEPIVLHRPALLQSVAHWRQPPIVQRSATPDDTTQMVYADPVPGQPDLFVRIMLIRPIDLTLDQWQVWVVLEGLVPCHNMPITLRCGSELREGRTNSTGEVGFTDIPAAWIINETAPDIQVTISSP